MAMFVHFDALGWTPMPGVEKRRHKPVSGRKLMAAVGEIDLDGPVRTLHQHPEEQISYVL